MSHNTLIGMVKPVSTSAQVDEALKLAKQAMEQVEEYKKLYEAERERCAKLQNQV